MAKGRVYVAKVVAQDAHGVTLFVPYHDQYQFATRDFPRFYTLMFVQQGGNGVVPWDPWQLETMLTADDPGHEE